MSKRRPVLEKRIQADIEVAIGSESDLLLLRNSCGLAKYIHEATGKMWHVPYGLGDGSPDLVGILRWKAIGVWFCLEVKCPGEKATAEQEKAHRIWRSFGALVFVVSSVEEARAALETAREVLMGVA